MNPAIVKVRTMQVAFIISVVLFFFVSRTFPPPVQKVNATFQWAIVSCAVFAVLSGFIVQRILRRVPNMPLSMIQSSDLLRPWFSGHVVRFATAESVAMFGLILRSLYGPSNVVTFLFAGSLLLLILWQPGEVPAANESQSSIR
jgi:hypothetical protein